MSKPIDYYAGYPNQHGMPKWVGVTLGSLFGGLLVVAVAVAIRLVMPPRSAQASVAQKAEVTAPVATPAPSAPAIAAADPTPSDEPVERYATRHHGKAKRGKHGKVAMYAKARPVKATPSPRYAKAQVFAKSVSSSTRDRTSRDELDKLLGL